MSHFVETPTKTFLAGAALAEYRRVKITDASTTPPTVGYAGATDVSIGTTEQAVFAAGSIAIRLRTAQGTKKMVAAGAITGGDPAYGAANGMVDATGTVYEGIALESSTALNDVIEVLPSPNVDVAQTITGTNAASFTVDADLVDPKLAISGDASGSGDFTITLKPEAALSADATVRVPEADGDTLVAVALAQTLTNKTLTSPTIGGTATFGNTTTPVAAAGTTVADAAALPDTRISHITSDGAGKGVKFPAVAGGGVVRIVINDSSTAAELYAESTGSVNGLSADASVVIPASKGVLAISTAAKTWIVFDLTAKSAAS
jgi:hypothetical protein